MKLSVQVDPVAHLCGQVRRSYNIVDESGQAVAVLTNTPMAQELAALIAAAPDLLAALTETRHTLSFVTSNPITAYELRMARTALAQADAALTRARGVTP